MFAIRLNDKYLDLAPNTAPTITIVNPLFDRDGAERLYTYTFKLPNTPTNTALLRHAHRLDNQSNATTYTGAVLELVQGVPFEHGILELDDQEFGPDGVNAVFKNHVPPLFEELDKIKINTILETIAVPQETTPYWMFALSVPPTSAGITYALTVNGISYSYTTPMSVVNAAVTQSLALALNADYPGLADAGFYDELRLFSAEANLVNIVLGTLTNLEEPTVVTVGQAAYTDIRAFVNDISFAPDERVTFPYIYWEKFYKDLVANYQLRANPWVDGDWIENEPWEEKFRWQHTLVPFVRLPYILAEIAAVIPSYFSAHTGFFAEDDGAQLIFFNNRSLDKLYYDKYVSGTVVTWKYLNGFRQSIDLNQHVPDLTAGDLFRRLMAHFALYMRVDGSVLDFIKKTAQLSNAPMDWTHLSTSSFTGTRKRRRGFRLKLPDLRAEDKNFAEAVFSGQFDDVVSGEGFTEIQLPFGSCKYGDQIAVVTLTGTLKCPAIAQPGSSDEGGIGDNPYSPRLLFDRGIQPTSDGDNYVMATHDNTNEAALSVGLLSLDLAGTSGLYQRHHRGLLQLVTDGTPITKYLDLSLGDITLLRSWTNSRRKVYDPDGEFVGIIKSIQFKPTATGIGLAKVEFVKQP